MIHAELKSRNYSNLFSFHKIILLLILLSAEVSADQSMKTSSPERVAPGIWRIRLGNPESITPVLLNPIAICKAGLDALPDIAKTAIDLNDIQWSISSRGCVVHLPMTERDNIYGFGLHLTGFRANNRRHNIIVSDYPEQGDGSGHAPTPFYVSTQGYGVFVDTLRYARFYCANLEKVGDSSADSGEIKTNVEELYQARQTSRQSMAVDIPCAQGVDIYVFGGPTMRNAVQRYNLFSGGGAIPPLWGLGIFYRSDGRFSADQILNLADYFRKNRIPCTVLGLEPGWHSHAYSCSYQWSSRFPKPDRFIEQLKTSHYQLNLWEQAFVHPTAPFYQEMKPFSGDYQVWGGLVPDFTHPEARRIFTGYHKREFVRKGITGFKLDECDNQPYKSQPWSFPELTRFPTGIDGEQMHSLFGLAFQRTMTEMFKANNIRTWSQVRASHALASPMPFVLYSDAYDHRAYVRGLVNSGFSGLLWQPEVRSAQNENDLYRRIQTSVFSPQTLINAWFIPNVPWYQIDENKNNRNELQDNRFEQEKTVRDLFELRMRLVPYFYSAFVHYQRTGVPPFRALVMDYPDDTKTFTIDDQYLAGSSLLIAPLFGNETKRKVYLPQGRWYCFWTNVKYAGGNEYWIDAPKEQIPVFVKENSILPLAQPVEYITTETTFDITARTYGQTCENFILYEDDGESYNFEKGQQNQVILSWSQGEKGRVVRTGDFNQHRYNLTVWENAAKTDKQNTAAIDGGQ